MKNSGLSNRFDNETRHQWLYWYDCMICAMNGIDALHHIISPSTRFYVQGDHNKSVLNSCPIHNQKCHIGKDGYLHREDVMRELLSKTLLAQIKLGYRANARDRVFADIHKDLYVQSELLMFL